MGNPNVIMNVVPAGAGNQPNISQERFKELFETPISPESRRKRDRQRNRIEGIRKAERASRKGEEPLLGTYEMLLGIRTIDTNAKPSILSEEQKQVIKTAILEESKDPEEQHVLRESIMGSTKEQEDFVALFTKWNSDWQADNNPDKPEFKEYVRLKGREFIKESAKEMRMRRADKFFDENRETVGMSDEEKAAESEKFRKALDMYFQSHGVALAELNSLDDKEKTVRRQELMIGFMKIMAENGLEKTDKVKIEALFDWYVGNFEYEYAAYQEYEATYEEMMEMALLGLTPEEWEARRQKALKENAKGELQEYLQQQTGTVYKGTYESASAYSTISQVANACGVNFVPAGAPDTYRISASSVKGNSFEPLMKVVYDPPEERTLANARFLIEQKWQDEDAREKEVVSINGIEVMTAEFKTGEVLRGVNTAILDWVMNEKITKLLPENAKQGTNRLIREDLMVRIAERLLIPFGVNNRPIREGEVGIFQRFMEVMLRDDEDQRFNALQKRVKEVEKIINSDSAMQFLQQVFKEEGGTTRTLGSLVEELSLKGILV